MRSGGRRDVSSDTTEYPGMPYTLHRAKATDVMALKLKCEAHAR